MTRLGAAITYPLYESEMCPPGFAESRLTTERLAQLTEIYWGSQLRPAEIEHPGEPPGSHARP
ncbi:hypothetical protein [Streptomyces sp. NPDC059639]|uniref:hypothetical protein n=1 Tax=Streptomyces sp. NPDC059639 TaxID=3346891 RepID=UPI0036899FD3